MNQDAIIKSTQMGFHQFWNKYDDYRITDGHILGGQKIESFEVPGAYFELPSQVAKLKNRKEKDLLKFVNTYGLLGFKHLNPRHNRKGEPLEWIWAHAETIYLVLELLKSLQDNDLQSAIRALKPYETESNKYQNVKRILINIGNKGETSEFVLDYGALNENSVFILADKFISYAINENIKGINTHIYRNQDIDNENKSFYSLKYRYTAMIEVVYWHLMLAATGGELKRCKHCKSPFISIHGSTEYCPKKPFERESLCALNYRQKERRKKQKGGNKI